MNRINEELMFDEYFGKPKFNSMKLTEEQQLRAFKILTTPAPFDKEFDAKIENRLELLKNIK